MTSHFDHYHISNLETFYTYADKKFENSEEISVIFDVGSCHCLESIEFSKKYKNAKIFAFEANPESYQICLENTKDIENITVVNMAVNDYDGTCKFYPIDPEKTVSPWFDKNRGASSLFLSNGVYDHIEKYVQKEIEVPCIRLDTFCKQQNLTKVDLLWMDLQGAELIALQSMGDELLSTVQVIHTELEMSPMYKDQCLFSDVNSFLLTKNFLRVSGNTNIQFGTDFIYVKI